MKNFLAGWRTRIVAFAGIALGILGLVDPQVVTAALGFGARGHSWVLIGFAVSMVVLRQVTTKPAAPILPVKK